MLRLLGWLLVVFLVITLFGAVFAVIKGLFWLAVVALVFFVATAALGRNKRDHRSLPR
jgi:apolipoprotein N-acyltransferase